MTCIDAGRSWGWVRRTGSTCRRICFDGFSIRHLIELGYCIAPSEHWWECWGAGPPSRKTWFQRIDWIYVKVSWNSNFYTHMSLLLSSIFLMYQTYQNVTPIMTAVSNKLKSKSLLCVCFIRVRPPSYLIWEIFVSKNMSFYLLSILYSQTTCKVLNLLIDRIQILALQMF